MKRFTHLDGLRGASAVIVTLHHFTAAFLPATYVGVGQLAHSPFELIFYNTPFSVLLNGNSAVCLFFVLSSYLVAIKLFDKNENSLRYAFKRYLRFTVPIFITVVLSYLCISNNLYVNQQVSEITQSDWFARQWQGSAELGTAVQSGLFRALFTFDREYISILWTMHIIFLGSIGTHVLVNLTKKMKRRWLIYLIMSALFLKSYYIAFILGIIIADLHRTYKNISLHKLKYPVLLLVLLLLSYPLTAAQTGMHPYIRLPFTDTTENIVLMHIIAAGGLIFFLQYWTKESEFFSKRIWIFFGKTSFSLYLIHMIVLGTIASRLFLELNGRLGLYQNITVTFAISLPLVVGVAYIYSYTVERWGIVVSEIFSKKQRE